MGIWGILRDVLMGRLGCSTLVGFILYGRANKRIKTAEALKEEVSAGFKVAEVEEKVLELHEKVRREIKADYVDRLGELKASLEEPNKRYHDALVAGAKKDDIIEDKTAKIRELNEVVYALQQKIIKLEKDCADKDAEISWLWLWHCSREQPTEGMTEEQKCEGCGRRKPAQPVPLKYVPFKNQSKK